MPDFGMEFDDLGRCFEFIDLALRNAKALRIEREALDEIYVTPHTFTVRLQNLPEASVATLRRLVQVRAIETRQGPPPGEPLTMNHLLERVVLVRQSQPPAETALAIALFGAQTTAFRDWYTQLLNMGCRGLRVGFVEPTRENARLSHILLVEHPPQGFVPPADWTHDRGWGARAITFYRLSMQENVSVYIEWGYEHPVSSLPQLYRFHTESVHGLFVFARAPHEERHRDDSEEAKAPHWMRIAQEVWRNIFALPEEALELKAARVAPRIDLQPRRPEHGVLEFQVERDRHHVGSLESLESKIAWHQQAIEQLQSDYRAAHVLRHEPVYLAYVFEQPLVSANDSPMILNAGLRRLLDQPYTHLRHLRYGFYEHPSERRSGIHVVIDTRPGSYAQVWTQPATEVYIQRQDWYEANLPLFVRNGDVLSPRLDDLEMLALIRKIVWDDHDHGYDQPVLLRTRSTGTGWEALYLTGMLPLTDTSIFHFLNDRLPHHRLAFRHDIPEDLATQLSAHQVTLHQRSEALHTEIAQAVEERIDHAEQAWRRVSDHIEAVIGRTNQYDKAITAIEEAMTNLPRLWDDFVAQVLESNNTLLSNKVTVYQEFEAAQRQRDEHIQAYRTALFAVKTELGNDSAAVRARHQEIEQLDTDARAIEQQLKTEFQRTDTQQSEVQQRTQAMQRRIEAAIRQKQGELDDAKQKAADLHADVNRLQLLQESLLRKQEEIRQQEDALTTLQEDTARLRQALARRQQNFVSLQQQSVEKQQAVKRLQQDIEDEENQLRRQHRVLDYEKEQLEERKVALQRDMHEHSMRLEALRSTVRIIEANRQSWKQLFERVEGLTREGEQWDGLHREGSIPPRHVSIDGELPETFLTRLRESLTHRIPR